MTASFSRRRFLAAATAAAGTHALAPGLINPRASAAEETPQRPSLAGQIGVTTSTFTGHLVARPGPGQFSLVDLPKIMREELDLTVIDLNTSSLASEEPAYLDQVRSAAEKAGCPLSNLKLNQRDVDMNSPDEKVRGAALATYKRSLDAAARLGVRWARPLPMGPRPDLDIHVASYQELCDYAAPRGIQMIVENYMWMESDPDSVVSLVRAIGRGVAPGPDIGNWANNEVRYVGLEKSFPGAVTCDFKAGMLGPDGEHPAYDLKRCFEIGWQSGFRGPWCFEHSNPDRKTLFKELGLLRDMLRKWTAEKMIDAPGVKPLIPSR